MSRTFSPSAGNGRQTGMTLVEMLVVLAIIGATTTIAVLSIGVGSSRAGQVEAERLAARLQLAADRTMLDGEAIALVPRPDGYRFVQWNADKALWQVPRLAALDQPYVLPRGMSLVTSDARPLLPLGADSGGQGFALSINDDGRNWPVDFDGVTARAGTRAATGS